MIAVKRDAGDGSVIVDIIPDSLHRQKALARGDKNPCVRQGVGEDMLASEADDLPVIGGFGFSLTDSRDKNTRGVLQIGYLNFFKAGKRVIRRDLNEAMAFYKLEVYIVIREGAALVIEYKIHFAKPQCLIEVLMVAVDDLEFRVRMTDAEGRGGILKLASAIALEVSDSQYGPRWRGSALNFLDDLFQIIHEYGAPAVKYFTGWRHGKRAVVAGQQLYAEFRLQRFDLLRHSGLRDMTFFRGFGKTAGIYHREKVLNLPHKHMGHPPCAKHNMIDKLCLWMSGEIRIEESPGKIKMKLYSRRTQDIIMANTLVIYYSRKGQNYVNGGIRSLEKGNTEIVAEYIAEAVGADLFEVDTVKEYSEDYMTCTEEAQEELRNNARPELKRYLDSVADYDNIVVAGPCWWGTYPCAVFTQLERLDFAGKKVYPVMTHEGSGMGGSAQALKKYCKGATVGNGLAVHGADAAKSKAAVQNWAKKELA